MFNKTSIRYLIPKGASRNSKEKQWKMTKKTKNSRLTLGIPKKNLRWECCSVPTLLYWFSGVPPITQVFGLAKNRFCLDCIKNLPCTQIESWRWRLVFWILTSSNAGGPRKAGRGCRSVPASPYGCEGVLQISRSIIANVVVVVDDIIVVSVQQVNFFKSDKNFLGWM